VNSARNTLILVLALTTVGAGALAWRNYRELVGFRAAALDPGERNDLQKKIADLEKANRGLQDELAAAHSMSPEGADQTTVAEDRSPPEKNDNGARERGRYGFRQQFAAVRELMAKPEVQAMLATEQKGVLDARYAALFKSLNLPPDQIEKLKTLLLDRQNSIQDVLAAAREQGINPRDDPAAFRKLVTDAQNTANDNIKSLLGDAGYDQLNHYEQTLPQRNVVDALQQRLAYSDSPLSASQAEQLVQILASTAPQATNPNGTEGGGRRGGPVGDLGGRFGGFGGVASINAIGAGSAPITPAALSQAQSMLAPTQVAALQQLQQQQQTAQQLQQLYRSAIQQGTTSDQTTGGRRRGGG
jgi:hypothetical protein